MSLTGVPLLAGAIACAVAALAGTVAVWHRWGAWRLLTRPLGVLLTEALVLLSVGLVVNRSEQFYPTWASLFQAGYTGGTAYATAPGGLDAWLAAQPGADSGQAVAFTWRQAGWPDWGLAVPPTVVVPAGYLSHKSLRYPVIVVLDGAAVAGTPGADKAGPAVVVFAHPTASARAATLATDLTAAVSGALRVTPYRWAVVADPGSAALGAGAVTAVPARFSTLVELCPAASGHPAACARRALPTGVAWTPMAARDGVAGELPPPLTASTPAPAYLPPPRRKPHPGASGSAPPRHTILAAPPNKPHKPSTTGTPRAGQPLTGRAHVAG